MIFFFFFTNVSITRCVQSRPPFLHTDGNTGEIDSHTQKCSEALLFAAGGHSSPLSFLPLLPFSCVYQHSRPQHWVKSALFIMGPTFRFIIQRVENTLSYASNMHLLYQKTPRCHFQDEQSRQILSPQHCGRSFI